MLLSPGNAVRKRLFIDFILEVSGQEVQGAAKYRNCPKLLMHWN